MDSTQKIRFCIIGGGWRAEFYLRIAATLPAMFEVTGVLARDPQKGQRLEEQYHVPTFRNLDDLLRHQQPSFVVVSVPWAECPRYISELAERGVPVLSETPPAPDLQGLLDLHRRITPEFRVQVAEQYPFQPYHQAILQVIESGRLGEVSHAQVSVAHGYHGIALMRKLLGIGLEEVKITAKRLSSQITAGPNRQGKPQREEIVPAYQDIAFFEFQGKHGLFDFNRDQYFSWIRSSRILVRGVKGEIHNNDVRFLQDFETPIHMELKRINAGENGNLEGYHLKGLLLGEQWMYVNPFAPARLSDDEIAVASCLLRMHEYVQGGPSFYSLAEASQDHYLNLLLQEAMESGKSVTSVRQPWCKA